MGKFSKTLSKRILNKGPKEGFCVICGDHGKLTRDHVPPEKCNNFEDHELRHLFPNENSARVGTTSQGGTHYKTICKSCNSGLLGTEYDPELVKLSNGITSSVRNVYEQRIVLPENIILFVKPQRIARSVVGHLLAANALSEVVGGLRHVPMTDAMREYFLDNTKPLPDMLDIYYWVYPNKEQVIMEHFVWSPIAGGGGLFGSVIKFMPLAFWLVWNKPKDINVDIRKLVSDKNMSLDDMSQIKIDLNNILPKSFPESAGDDGFVLLNTDYAVLSRPKE